MDDSPRQRQEATGLPHIDVMMRQCLSERLLKRAWPHLVILILQLLLLAQNLPLNELWGEVPLLHIDNAYHLYTLMLGANLAQTGNIVRGYDPLFAAGSLSGMFNDPSGHLPALLGMLVSPAIDAIHLYKLYVFVLALLCPLGISAASMVLGQTTREAVIAGILGVFVWWVSYLHWYFTAGMVSYVASAYLGILFLALLVRDFESGGETWSPVAIGFVGALGFFLHPLFPILIGIAIAIHLTLRFRRLDRSRVVSTLAVVSLLSLVPNLIWLIPTYLHYYQPYATQFTGQSHVDPGLIWRELLGQLHGRAHGSKTYPLLLAGALWGCTSDNRHARLWLVFLLSAIAIELYAYIGAAIPAISHLQPNRFAPAGYLLLCIPASGGISSIARAMSKSIGTTRGRLAAATAAVLMTGAIVLVWELWREVVPGPQGRYGAPPPQIQPVGPDSRWVIDWVVRRSSPDARVLFETSLGRVEDDAHMAGYYARYTHREFIGGPYPYMYFAGFWDGFLFGKPIGTIPFAKMAKYLSLYNVGAIIVYSDAAKHYFDAIPGVAVDAERGRLKAYRVAIQPSFFLAGSGHVVTRGGSALVVTDAVGPEVILKYHFVPGMVSEPPSQLDGVHVLDDPVPFVRVRNPPENLRLYVR